MDAFQTDVKSWLDSAKRPRCHRLYTEPTSRRRGLAGPDCSDEAPSSIRGPPDTLLWTAGSRKERVLRKSDHPPSRP